MEMFVKCDRCGALVETTDEILGGMSVKCAPCAVTTKVGSNDVVVVRDGCEHTVLCPDCMGQLKEWLAGKPEEPQVREEPGQSADGDSAERLAEDMTKTVVRIMADKSDGVDSAACHYFGHSGVPCVDDSGVPCRAYNIIGKTCARFALDDIHRRCEALGIDLGGEADAE